MSISRFSGLTNTQILEEGRKIAANIEAEVSQVIYGPELRGLVKILILSLFADGHVLVRAPIGLGKTLTCAALARTIGGVTKKRQFTPDMLPSELTGFPFYNQKLQEFVIRHGPLHGTNVFLADEINRSTPKTQSALLSAMEEQHLTIDNQIHELELLFVVLATRNPMEHEGTFGLPEAQLDRFFAQRTIERVSKETILRILSDKDYWRSAANRLDRVKQVTTPEEILAIREAIFNTIHVEEKSGNINEYIEGLVAATWEHPLVKYGSSPRGAINLKKAATVVAFMEGDKFVLPDYVRCYAVDILAHRIFMTAEARLDQEQSAAKIIEEVINAVKPD